MSQQLLPRAGADYPIGRPPFFANYLIRQFLDSGVMAELGTNSFTLLVAVVMEEDRLRYSRAPNFWNSQLEKAVNLEVKAFARARSKLVEARWLHYERENRRKVAYYWSMLPDWVEPAPVTPVAITPQKGSNSDLNRGGNTGLNRDPNRDLSPIPIPIPKPSPTPILVKAPVVGDGRLMESGEWGIGRTTGGSFSGALSNPAQSAVERLVALKVTRAGETIAEAQANGLTLEQIAAVITFAEAHPDKYGPGAVVIRLTLKAAAQFPADQGWPPAKPSPAVSASRLASDQAAARQAQRQADQAARAHRERLTQLELQYGPEIDAKCPEQLAELLTPDDPIRPLLFNRRFGPTAPLVRSRLLELLAASAN